MKRLRVAFMPMLPQENAATRAFCARPLPYLSEHGIDGDLLLPSGNRAYRVLLGRPGVLGKLAGAAYWYGIVLPRRLVQILRAGAYDVVFVQRSLFRQASPPVLEALVRLTGRRLVVHCDDAAYAVARPLWTRLRFRLAHLVLTGNDAVAAYARNAGAEVAILPGALEPTRYRVREHEQRRPVVIGWAGHYPELLRPIVPALAHVCRDGAAIVHVVGDRPFSAPLLGDALRFERWSLEREHALFNDFDIGIMPLPDDEFSRGKEAFKLKEYMAAGLPVVASPVGHNVHVVEHGVTGFLADDVESWREYLTLLVELVELRAELGAAGRRVVEARYSLPLVARELGAQLQSLADGTPALANAMPAEARHEGPPRRARPRGARRRRRGGGRRARARPARGRRRERRLHDRPTGPGPCLGASTRARRRAAAGCRGGGRPALPGHRATAPRRLAGTRAGPPRRGRRVRPRARALALAASAARRVPRGARTARSVRRLAARNARPVPPPARPRPQGADARAVAEADARTRRAPPLHRRGRGAPRGRRRAGRPACGDRKPDRLGRLPDLPDGAAFRRERLRGHEGRVVLSLGRITRKKALDVLVLAFATVARTDPSALLAIVGPDDDGLQPELEALARGAGIDDRVVFPGVVSGAERLGALAAADVFALPSHTENFGVAVVEALAAGVATVVSPAVNIAPELDRGGAAVVAAPTPADVAEALLPSSGTTPGAASSARRDGSSRAATTAP